MAMLSLSAAELRSFIGSSSTTMATKTHMIDLTLPRITTATQRRLMLSSQHYFQSGAYS